MTEQEEAVGRQRLGELTKHQKRLVELETDRDVLYPVPHPRHELAVAEYDNLAAIVGRLETDPFIPLVRLLDAQRRVTDAQEVLNAAVEELATQQEAVDKAMDDVTAAQDALEAFQ